MISDQKTRATRARISGVAAPRILDRFEISGAPRVRSDRPPLSKLLSDTTAARAVGVLLLVLANQAASNADPFVRRDVAIVSTPDGDGVHANIVLVPASPLGRGLQRRGASSALRSVDSQIAIANGVSTSNRSPGSARAKRSRDKSSSHPPWRANGFDQRLDRSTVRAQR